MLQLEGRQFWYDYKVSLYRLEALVISYLQSSDDPLYCMVIFLKKYSRKTLNSLQMRARFDMFFVSTKSDTYPAPVVMILHVMSFQIDEKIWVNHTWHFSSTISINDFLNFNHLFWLIKYLLSIWITTLWMKSWPSHGFLADVMKPFPEPM